MSIKSLLMRIWSFRYFIIASAVICAAAASIVVAYLQNRYLATATIQLDTRVESQAEEYAVGSKRIDAFVRTQAETIKDIRVTGRVVDRMGWTQSFGLAQEFNRTGRQTGEDFRTWLGGRVADRILLSFEEGSPSFRVSYVGLSPNEATTMAGVIRDAFVEYSATGSRSAASSNVAWIDQRLSSLRSEMAVLEKRNSEFGRQNDIILDQNNLSQAERSLAQVSSAPLLPIDQRSSVSAELPSPAKKQLAQLDSEIASLSTTLGPNHPRLRALQATRAELERAISQTVSTAQAVNRTSEVPREIRQAEAEATYLAKAEAIQTAKQYAAELAALEQQFAELSQRKQAFALDSATLRPTARSDGPVVPLGEVYYPRRTFAILGAAGFGALLAAFLGLFLSFLRLRVKSSDDLHELGIPVLGKPKPNSRLEVPNARRLLGSLR